MDELENIDKLFVNLNSKDNTIRYKAFQELLQITDTEVDWVYDKWLELVEKLDSDNSFQRSIGLMLLANLSKSDTENRISALLERYVKLFEDEKFITSRQCIQNVWKIALIDEANQPRVIKALEKTYYENIHLSSHANLIKQDVIASLNHIYKQSDNEEIFKKINDLIQSEVDEKLVKLLKKILN